MDDTTPSMLHGPTAGDVQTREKVDGGECTLPPLPPDTRPLSHQVAGHVYGKSSSKFGMLECRDGTILKPLPLGCCGRRELSFYQCIWGKRSSFQEKASKMGNDIKTSHELCEKEKVTSAEDKSINHKKNTTWRIQREAYLCRKYKSNLNDFVEDNFLLVGNPGVEGWVGVSGRTPGDEGYPREIDVKEIGDAPPPMVTLEVGRLLEMARHLTPTYLGTYVDPASPGVQYLRQDDVTFGFRRPCIADVKIGKQSYDPEASAEKIIKELNKYPPQQNLCFQLKGMRYYCRQTDQFTTCSKEYLRTLDENSVLKEGFARFFDCGDGVRRDVVTACVQKLDTIIDWVTLQRLFAFYASSILIVYEGAIEHEQCFARCEQHRRNRSRSPASNSYLARSEITGVSAEKASPSKGLIACGAMVNSSSNGGHVCMHRCVMEENWRCQQCWAGDASGPSDLEAEPELDQPSDGLDKCPAEWPAHNQSANCKIEVKMIDFARVFPTTELDTNYLEGLNNLKAHLVQLLEL